MFTSLTVAPFWEMYSALPPDIQQQARQAYRQFQENPYHPGLRFHPLRSYRGCWSVRVTRAYRAICRRNGDTLYWFWIGSHADFDRDFR